MFKDAFSNFIKFPSKIHKSSSSSSEKEKEKSSDFFKVEPVPLRFNASDSTSKPSLDVPLKSHSDTIPPTRTQVSSRNERVRPLSWHVRAGGGEIATLEGDRDKGKGKGKGNEIPKSDFMPRRITGDGSDSPSSDPSQKHVRFSSTSGNLEGFNYSRPIQYRSLQPSPSQPQSSKRHGSSPSSSSGTSSPRLLGPDQIYHHELRINHQQQERRNRANSDLTSISQSNHQLQIPQVHHHHRPSQPQSQMRVIYQNPHPNPNPSSKAKEVSDNNGHQRMNHSNQRERQRPARDRYQHHPSISTDQKSNHHSQSYSQVKISERVQNSNHSYQRELQPRLDDSRNPMDLNRQQSRTRNRIEREIDSRIRSGGVGTNAFLVSKMVKDKAKGKG